VLEDAAQHVRVRTLELIQQRLVRHPVLGHRGSPGLGKSFQENSAVASLSTPSAALGSPRIYTTLADVSNDGQGSLVLWSHALEQNLWVQVPSSAIEGACNCREREPGRTTRHRFDPKSHIPILAQASILSHEHWITHTRSVSTALSNGLGPVKMTPNLTPSSLYDRGYGGCEPADSAHFEYDHGSLWTAPTVGFARLKNLVSRIGRQREGWMGVCRHHARGAVQ
jgi:hypothetical protein